VLIVFYPLRAILLFVLSGHAAADTSAGWSDLLSIAEILLELWLVVELAFRLTRERGARTRTWSGAAIIVAALAGAWVTLTAAPGRVPVDRTQVFFWWAMLALGVSAVFLPPPHKRSTNLVQLCGGFAIFSLCQLMALAGRAHAFAERSRQEYVGWSYVPAAAYIIVVMYWLVFLGKEPARERKSPGASA
jgi:hypothetical protein